MKKSAKGKAVKIKIRILRKKRAGRPRKKNKPEARRPSLSLRTLALALIIGLNWAGLSTILKTDAYLNDVETSSENIYTAGALDFSLDSRTDFLPSPILPGESTVRTIDFINSANAPKYIVTATGTDGALCDYLNITAGIDGEVPEYQGSLKELMTGEMLFSDPDQWTFTAILASDTPASMQGQTCRFKLAFIGSQERNNLPFGQGFNDLEEIDNIITAGIWQKVVINKVYYDPDDKHSGEGPERKYEWIELYNPTDQEVNLKKWRICDNYDCISIDPNVSIPAEGYALVSHDATIWKYWEIKDGVVVIYELGGSFALNNDADMLILKNADNSIVDQMNWGIPTTTWPNYNSGVWNPGAPDVIEGHMLGRVPSGYDTDQPSDWHDLALPSVTVLVPNGGEVWWVGRTYNLTWTATNPNGPDSDLKIDLYYSGDSGKTWAKIATTTENDGIYSWRVPLYIGDYYIPSHTARIKAVAYGPENFMVQAWDMSDNDFCPPIDYSLLTEEELEYLVKMGMIEMAEIGDEEPAVETPAASVGGGEIPADTNGNGTDVLGPEEIKEESAVPSAAQDVAQEEEPIIEQEIPPAIEPETPAIEPETVQQEPTPPPAPEPGLSPAPAESSGEGPTGQAE
jgi:hypothetical protein